MNDRPCTSRGRSLGMEQSSPQEGGAERSLEWVDRGNDYTVHFKENT